MKMLVAGLAKTGTKTMATALTLLGYEVYDFMENLYYLGEDWEKQVRDGFKMEDMRRMYENVDAVVDSPCNYYWEEIFDAFPDVKVILITREDDVWLRSWKNHVEKIGADFKFRLARILTYTGLKAQSHIVLCDHFLARYKRWPNFIGIPLCDEALTCFKRRHERNIKQIVPEEQLLIYEVREGWKPLCDFLDLPVPDRPFPHKNKGCDLLDEYRREKHPAMQRIETELMISMACLFVLFVFICYKLTEMFV